MISILFLYMLRCYIIRDLVLFRRKQYYIIGKHPSQEHAGVYCERQIGFLSRDHKRQPAIPRRWVDPSNHGDSRKH